MTVATSTLHPTMAAFGGIGPPEVILIILVVLLLFGGRKLPEVARGTGRALRIFKAETKGLMDDDDEPRPAKPAAYEPPEQRELPPRTSTLDADAERQAAERRAAESRGDDPV